MNHDHRVQYTLQGALAPVFAILANAHTRRAAYDKHFSIFGELVGSWRSSSCPKLQGRGRSSARARPL